jgi:pimeloyl-ACP methyl ester carboxylesterase
MRRLLARFNDSLMCAMMDALQRRHRLPENFHGQWDAYVALHAGRTRAEYFAAPALDAAIPSPGEVPALHRWTSPVSSRHAENNRCHALLFPCAAGWRAPTVLMLHALMSASDRGYRQWARRFNERGWNAIFVHLPYHYSRTPRRHWNGELAITADAIRSAEALRAGVAECGQLMAWLRANGCREFGLWACSYGGWIGALLASVEADFRWVALIEPIIDVHHAIWESPAGVAVRRELTRAGITESSIAMHYPLTSPRHGEPLCGFERVIFAAGEYDRIAAVADIQRLSEQWRGSELLVEPQGHFGYRLMRSAWRRLEERGLI